MGARVRLVFILLARAFLGLGGGGRGEERAGGSLRLGRRLQRGGLRVRPRVALVLRPRRSTSRALRGRVGIHGLERLGGRAVLLGRLGRAHGGRGHEVLDASPASARGVATLRAPGHGDASSAVGCGERTPARETSDGARRARDVRSARCAGSGTSTRRGVAGGSRRVERARASGRERGRLCAPRATRPAAATSDPSWLSLF